MTLCLKLRGTTERPYRKSWLKQARMCMWSIKSININTVNFTISMCEQVGDSVVNKNEVAIRDSFLGGSQCGIMS